MWNWLWNDISRTNEILLSVGSIYLLLIVLVRFSGLRSFAKMTGVDFASTIAIGSILGATIISGDHSVYEGILAVGGLLLFQTIIAFLMRKIKFFDDLVSNDPVMLMDGKEILRENLKKVNVDEDELMAKLREANVISLNEVKSVVMETTGDISVLHGDSEKKLDSIILMGVKK